MSFADDEDTENAVIVDMQKRCGQFQVANILFDNALNDESASNIKKIMLFQIDRIKRKSTNAHCCDEIL